MGYFAIFVCSPWNKRMLSLKRNGFRIVHLILKRNTKNEKERKINKHQA